MVDTLISLEAHSSPLPLPIKILFHTLPGALDLSGPTTPTKDSKIEKTNTFLTINLEAMGMWVENGPLS